MASLFTAAPWASMPFDRQRASTKINRNMPPCTRTRCSGAVGAHGVIFLPYLTGRGSPNFDTTSTEACWARRTTKGSDLARAVLEGVASARTSTSSEAALGSTTSLLLAGGGFESRLWRDMVANVMNHWPSTLPRQPDIGPLGAAPRRSTYGHRPLRRPSTDQPRSARKATSRETPNPHRVEAYASAEAPLAAPRS